MKIIVCGLSLGGLLGYSAYMVRCWFHSLPIYWPINWCLYCILYTTFHLVEFFLSAIYRLNDLSFKSFLVNQSWQYMICTIFGVIEFWIEHSWFGLHKNQSTVFWFGFVVSSAGLLLRFAAEVKLGTDFTYIIRKEKVGTHELVTNGIYSVFRHPSYTGWFYYCVGREILLMNPINFLVTAISTWLVIYYRILYEEKYLLSFFEEYEAYQHRTHLFIPFLSSNAAKVSV